MTSRKWDSHEMNRAQGVLEKVEGVSTGINHIMDDLARVLTQRDRMIEKLDLDRMCEKLASGDNWLSLSEDQRRMVSELLIEWIKE